MAAEDGIDLDALAEMLGGDDEGQAEPDAPEAEEELEQAPDDEGEEDEAPDEDEADEEPARDTITVVGADGEPVEMKLDKLLADTLHEVEVGGEKRQVSYEDMRKGFMLQEDYSRKTAEVAKTREELMPYSDMVSFAKSDPKFVRYLQAYFVHGGDPVAGMSQYADVTDAQLDALLSSDDPEDLNKGREIAKERARLRQAMGQRQKVMDNAMRERAEMWEQWRAGEERRAKEKIPNYDDVLKGRDEYLKSVGFTEQDIASLVDHRMLMVLADALQVRRLREKPSTSSKQELGAKRKQPRPPRSINSGRGKPAPSTQTRTRKLTARAMESGSVDHWADALGARLGLNMKD